MRVESGRSMARITEKLKQRPCDASFNHTWFDALSCFTAQLSAEDRRIIVSAEGWLELGNIIQCLDELNNLTPSKNAHPAVLALYWRVHVETNNWEAAHHAAEMLCLVIPSEPQPWLWRAQSLKHMTANGTAT